MYAKETAKRSFERLTGVGLPSRQDARSHVRRRKAWATYFEDDGLVPNNRMFPFVRYRGAVDVADAADPAAVFERLFEDNGWEGSWRNGIYDYVHYHPRTHEVLGVAGGKARVRFGGDQGRIIALKPGDVVVLPAGTGHQTLLASKDLVVAFGAWTGSPYDSEGAATEEGSGIWR